MLEIGLDRVVKEGANLLAKFVPDKDQALRLSHDLVTLGAKNEHVENLAQLEVNKTEAAHPSLFVAGWRPALGWACVAAITNNYLLIPYVPAVEPMSLLELMPILLGMLGLSRDRTKEKQSGHARNNLKGTPND